MIRKQITLLIFLGLVSLMNTNSCFAQLSFGVKLSTGLNIIQERSFDGESTLSAHVMGLGAGLNIPLSRSLAIRPEINYLTHLQESFYFNALTVPVLLVYKPHAKIELEAGPSLQREFYRNTYGLFHLQTPYLNLGANAGASFLITDKFSLNLRYTYEIFRTLYNYADAFEPNGPNDPMIVSGKDDSGFRDTYLIASVRYFFK